MNSFIISRENWENFLKIHFQDHRSWVSGPIFRVPGLESQVPPMRWVVLACLRTLHAYVLTCQRALRAYVPCAPTCLARLRAHLPTCLRAYVVRCQRALRAYVQTWIACLSAQISMCLSAYVRTCLRVNAPRVPCLSWQHSFPD